MSTDSVLILFADLLGDYLLFRNHLAYLRRCSAMANDRPIYFIGNAAIKPLVEYLDTDVVDHFLWVEDFQSIVLTPKKLLRIPFLLPYWKKEVVKIGVPQRVEEFWCPSTGPWRTNVITLLTKARRKVGKDVESLDYHFLQKFLYNPLYRPQDFYLFMFDQHRQFFELATGETFGSVSYHFPKEALLGSWKGKPLQKPYCVVFPDSAETFKQWSPEAFAAVISYILNHSDLSVYICGHHSKQDLGNQITQFVQSPRVFNWMGQTTIVDIFDVIGQSALVLCNDSFALHAANAMAVPLVCVTQGLYYGRYLPYPKQYQLSEHHYVFPEGLQTSILNIMPEQVFPAVEAILKSFHLYKY